MRLGLNIGYSRSHLGIDLSLVQHAERLGFHSVWSAEAYGSDAVSPLCWIAARTERIRVGTAIMQIPARTPTLTATTALTIDQLSGGRFLLGLGVSGPQVVEGWHGVAFGKPLAKTREYVDIVRMVWKRERPVEHKGEYYQIPYAGPDATGLGKPLKSILHGRSDIPIYLAAIGPRNVALAAEIAGALRRRPHRADRAGARRGRVPGHGQAPARPVRGRHGGARQELLQRAGEPLRLRGRRQAHPGSLPGRQEGRGRRRGARRARGRGRAVRAEGAHPRAAAALEELRHHHADLRRGPAGGARADGGAGALGP